MEVGKRANQTTAGSVTQYAKIGGDFTITTSPSYIQHRVAIFEKIYKQQKELLESQPPKEITITLKDGKQVKGTAYKTTPYDIARQISKKLSENVMVASIKYTQKPDFTLEEGFVACEEEEEETYQVSQETSLWDLNRPLYSDCNLELHDFEDPKGKMAFWHSSAHILGQALENTYGSHLCIGPPLSNGFYYDSYMGNEKITPESYEQIEKALNSITKENQTFQRVVLSKDEALEMFKQNPFKVQLIKAKIPDNGKTIAYRCGSLIDLCTGPHLQTTGRVKSIKINKHSSAYWLGQKDNDTLQRIYGVSFPTDKEMKEFIRIQEEIAKRDHRKIGMDQKLFEFNEVSAGSAFFFPTGAILYNTLQKLIREEYKYRQYKEVITPNIYNSDLWKKSGHWDKYQKNMFIIKQEAEHESQFGIKPMNCPGHCMMFDMHLLSYRDLPLRLADFGVLHRNELHGALSGLTRVRRFCQDDAHIFCTVDQIQQEVMNTLEFIGYIYSLFGFQWSIELSTRPDEYLGNNQIWDRAEEALKQALDKFGKPWKLNPKDGAFYGPKIDIKLVDALNRYHQCGTVQLDFNLPIRFGLSYREKDDNLHDIEGKQGFARPVIIHRAVLGSIERFIAILTEHTAGKWPFFVSPRQVIVIPISDNFKDYAEKVYQRLLVEGFNAEIDLSEGTINKKVRNAQLAQINFMAVVGKVEEECGQVDLRDRDQKDPIGKMSVEQLVQYFKNLVQPMSSFKKKFIDNAYFGRTEEMNLMEDYLLKNMFFGGEQANEQDQEKYKNLAKFDDKVYPNISRWFNYMKQKSDKN